MVLFVAFVRFLTSSALLYSIRKKGEFTVFKEYNFVGKAAKTKGIIRWDKS